jgi:hypothetical protein
MRVFAWRAAGRQSWRVEPTLALRLVLIHGCIVEVALPSEIVLYEAAGEC